MKKLSVIYMIIGLASLSLLSQTATSKSKLEYPACPEKMSVGVDTFRTENITFDWKDFSLNARDQVVNELVNSGCYKVMERGGSGVSTGYDREQNIRENYAKSGQKEAKSRNVKLVGKLVTFAMTSATKDNIGGTLGGIGGSLTKGFGFGAISPKASKFCMTCRVYDSSTSEILASEEVCKSKVDFRITGGGFKGIGMGADFFVKTPAGQAIKSAIHDCAVKMTNKIY